jgi:tetratricopeptide (TPR) repeat protein
MFVTILIIFLIVIILLVGVLLQTSQSKKKFEKAESLFNNEKYEEALSAFQELYGKDTNNKIYNWYMGQCHENLGDYELALVEYNRAALSTLFLPPLNEVDIHMRMAMVNLNLGNNEKAAGEFQMVTTMDPKNSEAYYCLGVISKNKGELQNGAEYFEKAVRLKNEFPEAYLEHGRINYLLNHTDKARRSLLKAITQNPDLSEAHYYYGLIMEKDKVYHKSIEEFNLALQDERFKFDAYVHLGSIHMALEDQETAFNFFETALEIGTNNLEALVDAKYSYADHLVLSGDLNKAMKLWEEINEVKPRYRDVENKLQVFEEISKSKNLTRFVTSPKQEFFQTGRKLCKLINVKIERGDFRKEDFLEFIGTHKIGRDVIPCVLHLTRWTNNVGEIPVRELLGRVVEEGATKGIFISASHYSDKARDLSKIRPLELIEREKIEQLLFQIYGE